MTDTLLDYVSTGSFILLVLLVADVRFLHWRVSRLEACMNGKAAHETPYTTPSKTKRKSAKRKPNLHSHAMSADCPISSYDRSAPGHEISRDQDTVNGFDSIVPLRRN